MCNFKGLLKSFVGKDKEIVTDLLRGNYILTVEAVSIDNSFPTAFEVFGPVFLFGPDIIEGQSAAGEYMSLHYLY